MENLSLFRADKRQADNTTADCLSREEVTAIYRRHIATVYRVCYSLMGNRQDAEDAAQAVFLGLMQRKIRFSDGEHEKAWLITAARNRCHDTHRQWWRKKVTLYEETKSLEVESPAPGLPGFEDGGSVPELLLNLPPKLRIVLYLHYYEGYKLAEIAVMLDLNLNTVKTQLRTAKKRLKLDLEEE